MNPLEVANRIEHLCQTNGVTISKMLSACNLSKSVVDNLKKGSMPSADKISAIANYFNVSTDYLLGNEQKEKPLVNNDEELTAYLEELKTRPEMKMLFNLAKGATKEDVEKAVKIVEAFLKKD